MINFNFPKENAWISVLTTPLTMGLSDFVCDNRYIKENCISGNIAYESPYRNPEFNRARRQAIKDGCLPEALNFRGFYIQWSEDQANPLAPTVRAMIEEHERRAAARESLSQEEAAKQDRRSISFMQLSGRISDWFEINNHMGEGVGNFYDTSTPTPQRWAFGTGEELPQFFKLSPPTNFRFPSLIKYRQYLKNSEDSLLE